MEDVADFLQSPLSHQAQKDWFLMVAQIASRILAVLVNARILLGFLQSLHREASSGAGAEGQTRGLEWRLDSQECSQLPEECGWSQAGLGLVLSWEWYKRPHRRGRTSIQWEDI